MNEIQLDRGKGKTTELIEWAEASDMPVMVYCINEQEARRVRGLLDERGLQRIRTSRPTEDPVELDYHFRRGRVAVDNIDLFSWRYVIVMPRVPDLVTFSA